MLLCRGVGQYQQLGGTGDDSLGEAFDKVARMLGIDCSAGEDSSETSNDWYFQQEEGLGWNCWRCEADWIGSP